MLKNALYVLAGLVFTVLGAYTAKIKFEKFRHGQQDRHGVDIQLLICGALMVILGIAMIVHFI
jgi:hypothetical protein